MAIPALFAAAKIAGSYVLRKTGKKAVMKAAKNLSNKMIKSKKVGGTFAKKKPVFETKTLYKTKTGKISKAKSPSKKYGSIKKTTQIGTKPTLMGKANLAGAKVAKAVGKNSMNSAYGVQVVGAASLYQGARAAKNRVTGNARLRRLKRKKR
tara:strand:+ start:83 stop:538 length:456 start_codon:yes stop_codon:yes gene_type:complete